MPDKEFDYFTIEYLTIEPPKNKAIVDRFMKAGYDKLKLFNEIISTREPEEAKDDGDFMELIEYIMNAMDKEEITEVLIGALRDNFYYIENILKLQKLSNDKVYDIVIDTLTEEIIEYTYDNDLSELVEALNIYTNLSDLILLKLALNNGVVAFVKEIIKYIILDDNQLIEEIEQLLE